MLFGRGAGVVLGGAGLLECGIDTTRFGKLIFEDDDAARRVQSRAIGDKLVSARSDPELVARVTAMPSLGPLRSEELSGVETA